MIKKSLRKLKNYIIKPHDYPIRKGKHRNYIFIHINKTGGTSINKALGIPRKRHLNVKQTIEIVGEKNFNKCFLFTVVRNPWDKVVSHYEYRMKNNQTNIRTNNISFKTWVKSTYGKTKDPILYDSPKMFGTQIEWLKDHQGKIPEICILKFEALESDFKKMAKIIGVNSNLPHLNASQRKPYTKYYDYETRQIVRDWFEEDIQMFNFNFEEAQ